MQTEKITCNLLLQLYRDESLATDWTKSTGNAVKDCPKPPLDLRMHLTDERKREKDKRPSQYSSIRCIPFCRNEACKIQ